MRYVKIGQTSFEVHGIVDQKLFFIFLKWKNRSNISFKILENIKIGQTSFEVLGIK